MFEGCTVPGLELDLRNARAAAVPAFQTPARESRRTRHTIGTSRRSGRLLGFVCCVVYLTLAGCSTTPKSGPGTPAAIGHTESGMASFYGNEFQSRKTSNGEIFDQAKHTAAHRTLPFGTRVKVTNTQNSKTVIVRVNDRGPFAKGRIIDLSSSAFKAIANLNAGVIPVKLEIIR
jgi:rare lipoprotein A